MNKNEPVVLRPAFSWDCPECSHGNFELAIAAEMSKEELEEADRAMYGIAEWDEIPDGLGGDFLTSPLNVVCAGCEKEFPVLADDFGMDEENE